MFLDFFKKIIKKGKVLNGCSDIYNVRKIITKANGRFYRRGPQKNLSLL